MLKYLFVALMVYSGLSCAITFKEAKLIFRQLETKTNTYIVLHLDPSLQIEAYASPWGIYVTQGMLNFTTKDELAMVLGHELTHYLYQDSRHHPSVAQELRADHYGYKMCKNLKYKKCKSFILKMKKYFGEGGDDVHPIWSYRYKKLGEE